MSRKIKMMLLAHYPSRKLKSFVTVPDWMAAKWSSKKGDRIIDE